MSTTENTTPAAEPGGAFGKDRQFGNRLDRMYAIGEPFLLLGWAEAPSVATIHGEAASVKILTQRIDKDTGAPTGAPFAVNTVLSAVVEKVKALTPEELAAGPVVHLQAVSAKSQGGKTVMVLSWLRNLADKDDYSEFGLDASAIGRVVDQARPEGERMGF